MKTDNVATSSNTFIAKLIALGIIREECTEFAIYAKAGEPIFVFEKTLMAESRIPEFLESLKHLSKSEQR